MAQEALKIIDPRNEQNLQSLDISRGLVRGKFQGIEYVLKMAPGNFIESFVLVNGVWEPNIVEMISSYLQKPNQVVLDIGANIGATSIPLAKKYHDTQFYLFEPHPQAFSDLRTNCSYNQLSNVELINAAVSNKDGFVQFYASKDANKLGLSSMKPNHDIPHYDLIQVQSLRIDNWCASIKAPISIIKMDTQGTELEILKSATRTISRHRPIIFFEFESDYFPDPQEEHRTKTEILAFFKEHQYDLFCMQKDSSYFPSVNLNAYYNGDVLAVPAHKER